MEKPLRIALCTAAALALLACNTPGSRVRQHQEAFDAWPPQVQHNLRNGVIEVGYAPEMVFIALGAPHRKMDVVTGEAIAQVWTWWQRTPGVGISLGGFSSVGSHVGVGTGVTLGERSHREEKAVVEFHDGRVHQFRMPAR
ncbi:MAG: hypothetical protein V3T74_08030 [Gemmatimonadales bacterium]